jgi:hypothetical protein
VTERNPADIIAEIVLARTEAWSDFWRRVYGETTPTVRYLSGPDMQEIVSRSVPIKPRLVESDILVLGVGADFSDLEARVLGWMQDEMGISDLIGEIDPSRTTAAEVMMRIDRMEKIHAEDIRPAKSYLRHDPTKNHRKVRRK